MAWGDVYPDLPADTNDTPARGCVVGMLFSAACWAIFIVGLLALAGLIQFPH